MATVPGLTPVAGQPRVKRAQSRVQVADASNLQSPNLSPRASPVDTYSRPAVNGWLQLADSLSSINPSLQRFLGAMQEDPDDSRAAAEKYRLETPWEQIEADRKAGKETPFTKMYGKEVAGAAYATNRAEQLVRQMQEGEFDPETDNFDEWVTAQVQEDLKLAGGDRIWEKGYTDQLMPAIARIRSTVLDTQSKLVVDGRKDDLFTKWFGEATNMAADGAAPMDVAASIYGSFAANKDYLRIPFKEQQEMALQLADQLATQGKFGEAKALLEFEREDKGVRVGSLVTSREFGTKATDLYARIEADELRARLAEEAKQAEEFVIGEGLRMAMSGSVLAVTDAQVPDKNGELKTIPADTIRKQVAAKLQEANTQEANYRARNPEDRAALAKRLDKERFVGSGLEHPTWFTAMNGAYTQASLNNITLDKMPPTLVDSFDTYLDLHKDSPQYASKFLTKEATDFYEAARVFRAYGMAGDNESAIRMAFLVTRDPNQNEALNRARYESIDNAIKSAVSYGGSWWNPFSGGTVNNPQTVKQEISRLGTLLARGGMDVEDALEKAAEVYSNTHINVMGTSLKNDKRLPNDFATLAEQYVTEYAEKHGLDAGDLTISDVSNGTGGYAIFERGSIAPLDPSDRTSFFSISTLDQLRAANRDKEIKKTTADQNGK
jgi:hypothetical protein